MSTVIGTDRRAMDAVANVLPRSVSVTERDPSTALIGGLPVRMTWIGEGRLRNARSALEGSGGGPEIFVARRMSPGAREAIIDAGLSWVDETGAAHIVIDSIVVVREGRPAPRPREWSPSVVAVAEALLCGTRATVSAAHEATGLSTGSCTNALRLLEDIDLLESDADRGRNSARRVASLERLLDAYTSEVLRAPVTPELQLGVTWRDPVAGLRDIGERWSDSGISWACTGTVAASIIAPHLTFVATADAYVDAGTIAGLEAVARRTELKPIAGGKLTVRPFPTDATRRLTETKNGLRVAPWPRVYADLQTVGVRGEEAAEHLWELIRARGA